MSELVKKETLDQFVRMGGYAIVKLKNDKWKNVTLASRKTGLSRQTIYDILKKNPTPPSKTKPKYVKEFEESEGYRLLKTIYRKGVTQGTFDRRVGHIMTAFKNLGNLDPISWTEQHYIKIWEMNEFIREDIGFYEGYASSFHIMMKLTKKHHLVDREEFKGYKFPAGKLKGWFLQEPEIQRTANCQKEPDSLVFEFAGLTWGARASAMLGVRVKDINFYDYTIQVFEKKMAKKKNPYVMKYPPLALFRLLKRYIDDHNLKPNDKIFPRSYTFYNEALKEAGVCARLKKSLSTHILKHTFVSQGYRHGLSRETTIEMTGTEDQTIRKFYLDVDEKRIRHETQGLELEAKPFYQWVEEDIAPFFEKRYEELMRR